VAALADAARPGAGDLADAALFSSEARAAGRLRRRALLRALASRSLECGPQDLSVVRSPEGALTITGPRRLCVSHSAQAGWTLIGICTQPLGVDLEPDAPAPPLPLDALHPAEAAALAALASEDRPAAFARFWTVKEAALKALGRGLLDDAAALEARFRGKHAEVWKDGRPIATAETRRVQGVIAAVACLFSRRGEGQANRQVRRDEG
jgi:phosphopantetheinyl transferase